MTDEFNIKDVIKAGLRSSAASIPALASFLQLWNEHEAVELKRRLDKFWNAFIYESKYVQNKIQEIMDQVSLHEDKISYLSESIALIERAVLYARQEPSGFKQDLYAVAVVNSISSGTEVSYDEKLSILDAINMLTETDLNVLKRFSGKRSIMVDDMPEADGDDDTMSNLVLSLSKLISRGLISETSRSKSINSITFYGDSERWDNKWRIKQYGILPFGEKLLKLIQSNQNK